MNHLKTEDRAVDLLQDLIRFDTSVATLTPGPVEREAAQFCADLLDRAGLEVSTWEKEPGRTNVVARIPGRDRRRPALLLHGHLDVVPAQGSEWSVDPFAGVRDETYVWGRGAVDMKNFLAMVLAVAERRMSAEEPPARDVVLAFLADEEMGGAAGSKWMVEHHPELFADCDVAISEVGGFSVTSSSGDRAYLVESSRKGLASIEAIVTGHPGHGSLDHPDNAVFAMSAALARLSAHRWPTIASDASTSMVSALSEFLGRDLDPSDLDLSGTPAESVGPLISASLHHTANPTMFNAGTAPNVVPSSATVTIDGRFVPGDEDGFFSTLAKVLGPDVTMRLLDRSPSSRAPRDLPILRSMTQALHDFDPRAAVIPFCNPASTDNDSFEKLGITGLGFVPLQLPAGFNHAAMYHGIDERIPIESMQFGTRVLDRLLDLC